MGTKAPDGRMPEGWEMRVGPAGMENNKSKASGKHGMNFAHPQPTIIPGEDAPTPSANGSGGGHRAVTGAKGMPKGA